MLSTAMWDAQTAAMARSILHSLDMSFGYKWSWAGCCQLCCTQQQYTEPFQSAEA